MSLEELIIYLKNNENKKVILQLQGIISTNIEIKECKFKFDNMYLTIENTKNQNERIILNLHQLMRFNVINQNKILLEFEQLQNITINIK